MAVARRVLVLFAHPALQKSRVNRRMLQAAREISDVTFHDLYEIYPDFHINVAREQSLLEHHDVIVFQHPFYWYSCPAIMKEWLDLVLEYGYAYGPGGDKLTGKLCLSAITTGGAEAAYRREGHNYFSITELLTPFEQTARLCHMMWLPPFVVHGVVTMRNPAEIEAYAQDYAAVLSGLRDGTITAASTRGRSRINESTTGRTENFNARS